MAISLIGITSFFPITLLLLFNSPLFFTLHGFAIANQIPVTTAAAAPLQPPPTTSDSSTLSLPIQDLKLNASKLEVLLEMTDLEVYTKDAYIAKCEKKIEELDHTIDQLVSDSGNEMEISYYEQKIHALDEQVQELEAAVRSKDRGLQLLKVKAEFAESRVDLLASQVKTMSVVVPELWFQVQKLEQAQEVIERRTAELRRYMRNERCLFFKSVNKICGQQCQEMVAAYTSKAVDHLRMSLSSIKKYHHQMQGLVRREMDKHDYTAVLAGDESVFFLASVVFIFPIMLAWICLSSPRR